MNDSFGPEGGDMGEASEAQTPPPAPAPENTPASADQPGTDVPEPFGEGVVKPDESTLPPDDTKPSTESGDSAVNASQPTAEQTSASPKQPEETTYKQIRNLLDDKNFRFGTNSYVHMILMEKYNVLAGKGSARIAELAAMDEDKLKKTPEYRNMTALNVADEKQRPGETILGNEFVLQQSEDVAKIAEAHRGESTESALNALEDEEAKKIEAELIEKGLKDTGEEDPTKVPEEVVERIKTEAAVTARERAKTKRELFIAGALSMMGEYVASSIEDSDFSTFLDNFFSQATARGNSWGRYRENFADKGKKGEMIAPGEVMQHLTSKEKVVETLNNFFIQAAADKDHLGHLEKPKTLLEPFQAKEMSDEAIKESMNILSEALSKDGEQHVFYALEKALLASMHKKPEESMIDERIVAEMIKIGDKDHPKQFAEFAQKYNQFET